MSWVRRQGRPWHRSYGGGKFVCGSFFFEGAKVETRAVVPADRICRRCERLMLHAETGALSYVGQAQSRKAVLSLGEVHPSGAILYWGDLEPAPSSMKGEEPK